MDTLCWAAECIQTKCKPTYRRHKLVPGSLLIADWNLSSGILHRVHGGEHRVHKEDHGKRYWSGTNSLRGLSPRSVFSVTKDFFRNIQSAISAVKACSYFSICPLYLHAGQTHSTVFKTNRLSRKASARQGRFVEGCLKVSPHLFGKTIRG